MDIYGYVYTCGIYISDYLKVVDLYGYSRCGSGSFSCNDCGGSRTGREKGQKGDDVPTVNGTEDCRI